MNESAWLVWAAMGGHGLYVWGSLGACALLMAAECWLLRLRQSQLLRDLPQNPTRPQA
jgi:heme exporter protein CcmD